MNQSSLPLPANIPHTASAIALDAHWIDDHAKPAAVQRIGGSVTKPCNDWSSTTHRLQKHDAESFTGTRHRKRVGQAIVID